MKTRKDFFLRSDFEKYQTETIVTNLIQGLGISEEVRKELLSRIEDYGQACYESGFDNANIS